jgi:hypothetical protein
MSATCVDSHHISEIQRRYYQNSMLSVPRQEKRIVPRSNLTGSQRRRLKRKKREEEEMKDKSSSMESQETDRVTSADLNEAELIEIGGREKKFSKRSVHWNALSEINQTPEGREIVDRNVDEEIRNKESESQPTFFGWLSSYFQSR